jgi:hypothetical protein
MMTTKQIKLALRAGKWAWPGGYPRYFVTTDGCALSFDTVRAEWPTVCRSTRARLRDGWTLEGVDINYEDNDLTCAHSGDPIQCAYGSD